MASESNIQESILTLSAKINIAKSVIQDVFDNFRKPAILWNADKDSTALIHMIKEHQNDKSKKMYAIFIDHGLHHIETLRMIDEVSKSWNIKVFIVRNDDVVANFNKDGTINVSRLNSENKTELINLGYGEERVYFKPFSEVSRYLLLEIPLRKVVAKERFDCVFKGIRADTVENRNVREFIKRDKADFVFARPMLTFNDIDIWNYTFKFHLPIHPLYYIGYRSVDGIDNSHPDTVRPLWEDILEYKERRLGVVKEENSVLQNLKQWGYL